MKQLEARTFARKVITSPHPVEIESQTEHMWVNPQHVESTEVLDYGTGDDAFGVRIVLSSGHVIILTEWP